MNDERLIQNITDNQRKWTRIPVIKHKSLLKAKNLDKEYTVLAEIKKIDRMTMFDPAEDRGPERTQ